MMINHAPHPISPYPIPPYPIPNGVFENEVVAINHYTDRLFKFNTTRPTEFRFRSGEFVMIGLPNEKPIWRAYSVASPNWMETLEFFSIKVANGPLTSRLQKIQIGDKIWMRKKSTGTLVLDALKPGKRLFMFATGTGVAPFAAICREPDAYQQFDELWLLHTTRLVAELDYSKQLMHELQNHEILAELIGDKLHYYGATTRENSPIMGRITDNIGNGQFYRDTGLPALNPATDRAMICGSMAMLKDLKQMLESMGFKEGANSEPGDFVIEKAFTE